MADETQTPAPKREPHETRLALEALTREVRAALRDRGVRESSGRLEAALRNAAIALDVGSIELLHPSGPDAVAPLEELAAAWDAEQKPSAPPAGEPAASHVTTDSAAQPEGDRQPEGDS